MDVIEAYDAISALVSVDRKGLELDYREVLSSSLKSYMLVVELMSKDGLLNNDEVKEIGRTCDKLKDGPYHPLEEDEIMKVNG